VASRSSDCNHLPTVVGVTLTGEDDLSHYLSEYFGSWRSGVRPGAVNSGLAQIRRRATRYRLMRWRTAYVWPSDPTTCLSRIAQSSLLAS
jgi:hypothetical protein